jgi:ABC-type antimicrobial peptide transport system permease subunit
MALGADSVNVIWLVMRRGISVVALGLAAGTVGSVMLTRVLESALYGIKATDPGTFAGVSVLLALVALCACWIPAGRAARVDPAVTLRAE